MLVLVTGGTGYVGSHAIAALASAGYRVRVLARPPDKIPAALEPLGIDQIETVIGDVTDAVPWSAHSTVSMPSCTPPRYFRWIPPRPRRCAR
jgi:uncharacterized protein YbjT (DUF2867 family)